MKLPHMSPKKTSKCNKWAVSQLVLSCKCKAFHFLIFVYELFRINVNINFTNKPYYEWVDTFFNISNTISDYAAQCYLAQPQHFLQL